MLTSPRAGSPHPGSRGSLLNLRPPPPPSTESPALGDTRRLPSSLHARSARPSASFCSSAHHARARPVSTAPPCHHRCSAASPSRAACLLPAACCAPACHAKGSSWTPPETARLFGGAQHTAAARGTRLLPEPPRRRQMVVHVQGGMKQEIKEALGGRTPRTRARRREDALHHHEGIGLRPGPPPPPPPAGAAWCLVAVPTLRRSASDGGSRCSSLLLRHTPVPPAPQRSTSTPLPAMGACPWRALAPRTRHGAASSQLAAPRSPARAPSFFLRSFSCSTCCSVSWMVRRHASTSARAHKQCHARRHARATHTHTHTHTAQMLVSRLPLAAPHRTAPHRTAPLQA